MKREGHEGLGVIRAVFDHLKSKIWRLLIVLHPATPGRLRTLNSCAVSKICCVTNMEGKLDNVANTADTSGSLIAASKVNGTAVYNRQGERLGSIYDVMINKMSGQATYAIMSFGGWLGIGNSYHPLPWRHLTYDEHHGGYVVDIDRSRLEGAPSYGSGETMWNDPGYGRKVDDYYGATTI